MRDLPFVLVVCASCALEHPTSRWDGGMGTEDAPLPEEFAEDVSREDARQAPDATEVSPDEDAASPTDIVDAVSPTDIVDVVRPTDIVDVVRPTDIVDVVRPTDIVDVVRPTDIVDVVRPTDIVDVAPTDAGSPRFTLVSNDTRRTERAGDFDGFYSGLDCNAGEVLVGAVIRSDNYVNALAARCAAFGTQGTLGMPRQTGIAGGGNGNPTTNDCPAGMVVVGLTGRAGAIIDQLTLQCAPLAAWIPGRAVSATTAGRGGSGGTAFSLPCPEGYVGFGFNFDRVIFALGTRVAQLRLSCVRVNLQP